MKPTNGLNSQRSPAFPRGPTIEPPPWTRPPKSLLGITCIFCHFLYLLFLGLLTASKASSKASRGDLGLSSRGVPRSTEPLSTRLSCKSKQMQRLSDTRTLYQPMTIRVTELMKFTYPLLPRLPRSQLKSAGKRSWVDGSSSRDSSAGRWRFCWPALLHTRVDHGIEVPPG